MLESSGIFAFTPQHLLRNFSMSLNVLSPLDKASIYEAEQFGLQ